MIVVFLFRIQADCGVYGGWPFLTFQYLMKQVIPNFFSLKIYCKRKRQGWY